MSKQKMKQTQSKPLFMQKLEAVERLQRQADATIYAWVKLLVEVAEDVEFLERLKGLTKSGIVSDDVVCRELDKYTMSRTGFGFERLWALYREFPGDSEWATHGIAGLDVILSERGSAAAAATPKKKRHVISRREHEELKKDRDRLDADIKTARASLKKAEAANRSLAEQLDTLKSMYRKARLQIEELQTENEALRSSLMQPLEIMASV